MNYRIENNHPNEKPLGATSFATTRVRRSTAVCALLLFATGIGLVACGSEGPVNSNTKSNVESAQKSTRYFGLDSPALQAAVEQARQNSLSGTAAPRPAAPSPASAEVEPEAETIQCSVNEENASLSPERRAELRATIERQSVPVMPPNFREREAPPSLEEMNRPPTPFDVRIPPDEVLDRQAAFFERRERATPDLAAYRGARRADISREIEQTRGMTPEDIGRAVQRGDLSFEAAHAIATAEANRDDYREKYETISMAGEPTFVEDADPRR